jgi:ADP-ribosyl-[dinitrogen reductase] hydrolase
MRPIERARGCLLGLAVADAVGTTLEFRHPGTFVPIDDMVGGGPFNLQAGQWTDDTSMALCLAASLVEKGFDPADQMQRYRRWYKEGYMSSNGRCFDIGNTVRQALHRYEQTGNPWAGSTDPYSAGNGSIMRLAPVPIYYHRHPAVAIIRAGESSRTTHGATAAIDACRYLAALILGTLEGEIKNRLLSPFYSPLPDYWQKHSLMPDIATIAAGSFKEKQPPDIKGSGYVVHSLEAALWAFYQSDNFRAGCLLAANLGDDADTTAAVFGQIAGAYYGESGIPAEWRTKVTMHDEIVTLAEQLYYNEPQKNNLT